MKKTFYHDGIEVDETDLNNTEDTKIDEILKSRGITSHFGVIEGLSLSGSGGTTLVIAPGRATTLQGEILEVNNPITVTELSVLNGVYTYIGLRYIEVASLEKPHELDPVVENTRIQTVAVASSFISSGSTQNENAVARAAALAAQNQTGTFVLLAEVVGTGTGVNILRNTPQAKSQGGFDPPLGASWTDDQRSGARNLYVDATRDEFALASAEDNYHRSLIGSGIPSARNPHGLTSDDLGFTDQTGLHQKKYHSNGILGFDPDPNEFAPNNGTFSWTLNGTFINVAGIQGTDIAVVNGLEFSIATNGSTTTIDMTGQAPGLFYILAFLNPANGVLEVIVHEKGGFDVTYAPYLNHGTNIWVDNAIFTDGEHRFLMLGLVRWDGLAFLDLSTVGGFAVPLPGGALVYNDPIGFTIPPGTLRLDLRRWGTITSEQVQRRTINIDRLASPVVTVPSFNAHAAQKVLFNGAPVNDDTVLSHLTNTQATLVFGHRLSAARDGFPEHPLANAGTFNVRPSLNLNQHGFMTNVDAWKAQNLYMTILKFSNANALNPPANFILDAAGDDGSAGLNSENNPFYVFLRPGFFMNFLGRVGKTRTTGTITATFYAWQTSQGLTPLGKPSVSIQFPAVAGSLIVGDTTSVLSFPNVSNSDALLVAVRLDNPGGNSRNFTFTCEYHFVA